LPPRCRHADTSRLACHVSWLPPLSVIYARYAVFFFFFGDASMPFDIFDAAFAALRFSPSPLSMLFGYTLML